MWQDAENALSTFPQTYEISTRDILYDGIPCKIFEMPENANISQRNSTEFSQLLRSELVLEAVGIVGNDTMLLMAGKRWIKIPRPDIDVMPGDKIAINYHYPTNPLLKEFESIELTQVTINSMPLIIWQKS